MTRAQCYYEILGIAETASSDDIKKAYRSMALVWHPDKNQTEEAHCKFQKILKAYETLSDSRERDWYDRHKDQILSDGQVGEDSDNLLNLFQYFSSACYANFDDAEDGYYTVYRDVFEKLAKEEEEQALKQSTRLSGNKSKSNSKANSVPKFPSFGKSDSDYEDVVRPFYAFWSSFCTYFTFDNLDKYKTTDAENRRILRAMEKENKKVRDQAKKERNNNIRNLVEFVQKRDKRVKAHRLLVEQQNELNRQKSAEMRRQQREKAQKESAQYKPPAWDNMDDMEEKLRQLESQYDEDEQGSDDTEDDEDVDDEEAEDTEEAEKAVIGDIAD